MRGRALPRLAGKLDEQDILLSIFSSVEPNPSVETVEKIAAQYKIDSCDCFLVIGGGSPMDAAKAAASATIGSCMAHAVPKHMLATMHKQNSCTVIE